MQRLGLKLWSVNTDYYLAESQRLYARGVYDYIELYVVPGTLPALPAWQALAIPYIIHCPHFAHGFNLAKAEKRDSNRRIYAEVKQYADALRATRIIFHGGIDGSAEETARQLAALQEPRALIENKPLKALPNRMGGNFCRGYNPEEIAYIQRVANCGFCLDIGHAVCSANSQGREPYAYVSEFMRLAPGMVHLSDIADMASEYDAHPHLGTGQLDLDRIIPTLPEGCPVSLETVKSSPTGLDDFEQDVLIYRDHAAPFRLRPARASDMEQVFHHANDPLVRQNSLRQAPIEWASHVQWFTARLNRQESPFYIVEHTSGAYMGQVRLDPQENGQVRISISLTAAWRGKGLSSAIIRRAIRAAECRSVVATIRTENLASQRAFEKAGFRCTGRTPDLAHYAITPQ